MPSVFVTAHGAHFHAVDSCAKIRAGQRATHSSAPLHSVPLTSIHGLSPCLSCYPDAPRARFFKRRCGQCKSARPCPHNGGVLVYVPVVWRRGTNLLAPGTITHRRRYVWPDVAYLYDRVVESGKV